MNGLHCTFQKLENIHFTLILDKLLKVWMNSVFHPINQWVFAVLWQWTAELKWLSTSLLFLLLPVRWCISLCVKCMWELVVWNVPRPGHSVPSSLPVTHSKRVPVGRVREHHALPTHLSSKSHSHLRMQKKGEEKQEKGSSCASALLKIGKVHLCPLIWVWVSGFSREKHSRERHSSLSNHFLQLLLSQSVLFMGP